jgi:hypothetical protein
MTTESTLTTARNTPADAPANLVDARELGRVVDLAPLLRKYDPHLVETVVNNMTRGDELGYAAWKALRPLKGRGKQMQDQAIREGIDSVSDAPDELKALFAQVDEVPDWVDWDQLERGAIAYWRAGVLVPIVLGYSSVGFGYYSYGGTKALNFTRLLIEPDRAGARMTETLRWIATVTAPGNMRRDRAGFAYSIRVRMVHSAVRFGVSRSPKWQWNDWGLPITNTDLFFTSSNVFCANVVQALERLGVQFSAQEKEDIFALWRYIGYVMGVPDDLNFVDAADSRRKNEVVMAVEREPDDANRILLHSLLEYTATATDGYQPFPQWIVGRLTREHKLTIAYGLLRNLTSTQFCEDMHVPNTRFKHAAKALAGAIKAKEIVARRLPHDDAAACGAILSEFAKAMEIEDELALASQDEVQTAITRRELEHTMRDETGVSRA